MGEAVGRCLMIFPVPEAAALHACRVVHDDGLRDHIVQVMTDNYNQAHSR